MATYRAPGVFVEEIDTAPPPLTPAETAIPAFIGYTATRPEGDDGFRARLVTSWQSYLDQFGGFDRVGELTAMLPIAVKGYFDEGGRKAYIVAIAAGSASTASAVSDVDGNEADGTGIRGLSLHKDVTMLICPDLDNIARTWGIEDGLPKRGDLDPAIWTGVQQAMLAHCEQMGRRMAILDPPRDAIEPQAVLEWRTDTAGYDTPHGALYYPWITVVDPHPGADGLIAIPPSGHVAGVWARSDANRGVWRAPANEPLNTVRGVVREITRIEQEGLNPEGINAIVRFGARGVRVWGARTLSATDAEWRYISVRRLVDMIEHTILEQTQWVVFEPNDETLWERVSGSIRGFLTTLWRNGAFAGATTEEAFVVRCDAELNPTTNQQSGLLIVEIAIAPLRPAEFIVVRLSQKTQAM